MASPHRRPKSHLRKLLGGCVVSVARAFAPASVLADGPPVLDARPRHGRVPGPGRHSQTLGIRGADPRLPG
ncbi:MULTISPECIES: hypothetical protein [unclassified Corallococcus]|uniref:hypothetical protein n=1 Tax=unclassified Corallococcus TaxID=2685029 RepID=UPI001A8F52A2|nr:MULTISPECIES: hypothetical protein [unclassified Corallococcus]MBN9684883.1 hypothetical protein [Corallococcus sp. NCSPR001]WAS83653.1 hypothetical protein O0N60_30620 [Corallococcus sp. NCRR]